MATVDKAFRIKNGLVVEGSTATVNGSNVLTEASTEFIQDTAASLITSGTHSGITFTYDDNGNAINASVSSTPTFSTEIVFEGPTADSFETTLNVVDPTADRTITLPNVSGTVITTGDSGTVTNTMLAGSIANDKLSNSAITINGTSVSLGGSRTLGTDDVSEGSTNKYFTDERAQDAVAQALANGTHTNITVGYDDATNAISLTGAVTYTDENAQDAVGNALGTGLSYNDSTGAISVDTTTIQAKVANVSDTEIGYLDGVTSAIQTQLNDKQAKVSGVSDTEIGYLDGVTSGIQTQLNAKFNSSDASTSNITEGTNQYFTDERAQDAVGNAVGNGLDYDDASGAISVDPSEFTLNAIGTATADVSMGTYKITNLGTPTSNTDAATKAYVDSVTEGLHIHESVVAATTANVNLANSLENGDTLDGVTLATGNRILVKNQTTTSENGIYVVQASGQPSRATDFDTAAEVDSGDFVFVYSGTVNGSTGWVQTNRPATIGTDAINFTQFSGAGTYGAGNGLTLTGTTFSINTGVTVDLNTAQTLANKSISGSTNTLTNIPNSSLDNSAITINGTSTSLGGTRTLGSDDIAEGSTNKYFTDERAQDAVGNAVGTGLSYNDTSGAISVDTTAIQAKVSGVSDTEIGYLDGVTSAIQTQLNEKAPLISPSFTTPNIGAATATSITLTDALIGTATQALTDNTATIVDSWSAAAYSSAKYIVQMKNGNDIEVLEVLVTVNGDNNVYITEYADVQSNAQIGTTDADYSGGNVRLKVTASNGTTVKVHKTLIEA